MKINNETLARSLRESRPQRHSSPSDLLLERVMAEVRTSSQYPSGQVTFATQSWWLAAAAAVALVVAGGLMRPGTSHSNLSSGALVEVGKVLEWNPSVALSSQGMAVYDPAAVELEALRRDGERALKFVRNQAAAVSPLSVSDR